MKGVLTKKVSDLLVEEVLLEIGEENIISIDPDSIDSLIQEALDGIETRVYEKTLENINSKLATYHAHLDKWW